jgi:hypothetical protein
LADIFFSYAKVDSDRVKPLIDALEAEGWNVWWDDDLSIGGSWSDEIEAELNQARCAVVAWTQASINSDFVRDEARRAHKARKLVPVRFDLVELPMGFGGVQAADFSKWNKDPEAAEFVKLREAIRRKLNTSAQPAPADVSPASISGPPASPAAPTHAAPHVAGPVDARRRIGTKEWVFALTVVGAIAVGAIGWFTKSEIVADRPPDPATAGHTVFVHSTRPQADIEALAQKLRQAGYKVGGSDSAADNDSGRVSPRAGVDYAVPDPDSRHQAAARAVAEITNELFKADIKPRSQSQMSATNLGIWLPYKGDYNVTIRFAGNFDRKADIVPFVQKLRAAGWRVQEPQPDGGNDRTSLAVGRREVRYTGADDRAFADLLAADVQKAGIVTGAIASTQVPGVTAGNLELWISSTGPVQPAIDPRTWGDRPPDQAYCYQRKDSPATPGKFLVRCFQTESGCTTFQPTDSGQKTLCSLSRGLSGAPAWRDAGKGGANDSWFKYSNSEFVRPFPEF